MNARTARISLAPTTIVGYRKNGQPIFPIAGGSPDPPAGGDTPPADPPADPPTDPPADPPADPDPVAEAEKWKALARKHENQAKANAAAAKRLAEMEKANQSDTEKAIADAEERGRKSATTETGQLIAAAEIKAALTGIVPDPAAIVEDLNLAKYVTDMGAADADAIAALRTKYAGFAAKTPPADLKQGDQGGGVKKDLDAQIAEAQKAGNVSLAMSLINTKLTAPKAG